MRISDWSSDVCSSDLLSVRSSVLAAPIREKDGGDIVVEHDRGSIRVDAWQFGTSLMLVFGAFVIAATARGQIAAVGRTWAIAEPDALSEIETSVAQQPKGIAGRFGDRKSVGKGQSVAVRVVHA